MPLTAADQRRVDEAEAEAEAAGPTKLVVRSPTETQKLGSFTTPGESSDSLRGGEDAYENVPRSGGEKNYVRQADEPRGRCS
ncbi:MAG: hypothetical protein Q9177_005728 [Variospora cf. flavescens]